MNNFNFGQALNFILETTGQSKGSLAFALGYDSSYITKWINNTRTPSHKNINTICQSITKFVLDSSTEHDLISIMDSFNIEKSNNIEEQIETYLPITLNRIYKTSKYDTPKHTHNNGSDFSNCNSMTHSNPTNILKYLENDISLYRNSSENLEFILICDLNNINQFDKSTILTMKTKLAETWNPKNVFITLITNIKSNTDIMDIKENIQDLLFLEIQQRNITINIINSEQIEKSSLIFIEKERIFHYVTYDNDKRCLFTTTSKDKDVVRNMFYKYRKLHINAKPIFKVVKNTNRLTEQKVMNYIIGKDIRFYINQINELFLPLEILKKYAKELYSADEAISFTKMNTIIDALTSRKNIQILFTEEAIYDYVKTREMNFFGQTITISKEDVICHLEYIRKLISDDENSINVKVLSGEQQRLKKASIYLSEKLNFMRISNAINASQFSTIEDRYFIKQCNEIFEYYWEEGGTPTKTNNEKFVHIIESLIECIRIEK